METKLPGLRAAYRYITPQCRERGDEVCIDEALETIRAQLQSSMAAQGNDGATFHVAFSIEWPKDTPND